MKFNMCRCLMAAAAPLMLAACETADRSGGMDSPTQTQSISSTSESQMLFEASSRGRVRDLRAEVIGNISYLSLHLGEDRSHILDMQDSLLVSIPGRAVFENSDDRFTGGGIDAISQIAASMVAFPQTRITVVGHVIGTESAFKDQILSERRAVAVKSVLMSRGIDECRIGVLGKGSDDHIAVPVSERRNQYNDRIEILMKPFEDNACQLKM